MRRPLTITWLALMSTICFAHGDTVLKLDSAGRLSGLPAAQSPASLRVVFSQSTEPDWPSVSRLELKIGRNSVTVPSCVTYLIRTRGMKDVRVVASWQYDVSRHPPYLIVSLFDP